MRILLNIISVCIIAVTMAFAYLNMHNVTEITLYGIRSRHVFTCNSSVLLITASVFILGFLAGIIWAFSAFLPLKKKFKEYQRKLERTSLQTDEDASKVSVLEAKIKTLEKALNSALQKDE